ncbi:hypothetical protein ACH4T9_19865 [Micromonospora sp. NPDC020750]|uniref:hypothetical protein n=1 Tax=unclassified Micromonospora TaxID=2617518 RepID=UPI00378CC477
MRRWLARLVDAEVRRLAAERDEARRTRAIALHAAVRWHRLALTWRAGATAPAPTNTEESTTP